MHHAIGIIFTVVISYLIGSLNSPIIVCKILKGKDIREFGSKNAGLTNVLRVFGKGPALATLLCDLAKGVIAVVLCRTMCTHVFNAVYFSDPHFIGYIAGISVMLGHCFPVFYGFHGGKGVLIAATTLIAIDPLTCFFAVSLFAILLAITKYVSVGSIFAAISYPVFTFIDQNFLYKALFPDKYYAVIPNTMVGVCICILIVSLHHANIGRLLNGTENKFGQKKPAGPAGEAK